MFTNSNRFDRLGSDGILSYDRSISRSPNVFFFVHEDALGSIDFLEEIPLAGWC